jgi:hypothetical protein
MNTLPRIVPPSLRLVSDVVREAKNTNCRIRIMRNRVVMLPRKAANQNFPEAA